MAYMYKNFMRAIAKWPRDPHKGEARNLLPYLQNQVNIAFKQAPAPPPMALCERRLKALNELLENKHVTDFPNNYKTGMFGLGLKQLEETNSDAIRNTIGLGAPKEGFFKSLFGQKKAVENA
uniref:Ubiquinol-cytochrome-c reductase complex assembly factor 2 n=1 Tax=Panagrellus redivivus TaxID=6233 RepID=A0A7E5A1V0_PANRE